MAGVRQIREVALEAPSPGLTPETRPMPDRANLRSWHRLIQLAGAVKLIKIITITTSSPSSSIMVFLKIPATRTQQVPAPELV